MKLLELNIKEYGNLKNRRICPGEGLTLIEGANESGKSMIMEFILFMLYGLPRRGLGAEAERGISRDGHRAAGSMRLLSEGREYTIDRQITESTSRRGHLRVVDMTDGTVLKLGVEPGEHFLGVPREVYVSSCSIGQLQSALVSGKKEASAIGNLLSGGDETVNVNEAEKKLDAVRVRYRHKTGKGGALVDQGEQVARLRRELEEARGNYARVGVLEAEERRLVAKLSELSDRQEQAVRRLEQVSLKFTVKQFDDLHKREDEREALAAERNDLCRRSLLTEEMPEASRPHGLRQAAEELDRWDALLRSGREQLKGAEREDRKEIRLGQLLEQNGGATAEQKRIKRGGVLQILGVISAFLGCGGCIAASVSALFFLYAPGILLLALGIVLVTAGLSTWNTFKKTYGMSHREAKLDVWQGALEAFRREQAQEEALLAEQRIAECRRAEAAESLSALLLRSLPDGEATAEAARAEADRLEQFLLEYRMLGERLRAMDDQLSTERERLSGFPEEELRRELGEDTAEISREDLERAKTEKRFYAEQEATLRQRLQDCRTELISRRSNTASPTELADRLAEAERELCSMEDYFESLVMAMDALSEASATLRGNVSPVLGRTASGLMDYVSDGRYGKLMTGGRSMIPSLCDGDGLATSAELLSGGTRDAAYLCLRIALMMQLFPDELPPLLLDESLCQMDEGRVARVLCLLSELCGKNMQCMLFTCHRREREICLAKELSHSYVSLSSEEGV